MTSSLVPIQKIFDDLSESYSDEFFVQAIFSAVPPFSVIGGCLTARAAKLFRERVELFMQETVHKLKLLESLIDHDFLGSEEFAYLGYRAVEKAGMTYQKEKIEYFSNIIVNAATIKHSELEYKEQFLKIVDDLNPIHIQILRCIIKEQGGRPVNPWLSENIINIKDLGNRISNPRISNSRLESICRDLVNRSLLLDASLNVFGYEPGEYTLTEFALEFWQFITLEAATQMQSNPITAD